MSEIHDHMQALHELVRAYPTINDFGTISDGDNHTTFQAAAASGERVVVPWRSTPYLLSNYLDFVSGTQLIGLDRPTLKCRVAGRILRLDSISDVVVEGIEFDGNAASVTSANVGTINSCTGVKIRDCGFTDTKGSLALTGTTSDCVIEQNTFDDSAGTAMELNGASVTGNRVLNNNFTDSVGFGIWLTTGANRNLIQGNKTFANGIELIGVTFDCWGNRIIGNHAEGCLDNGISVTGFNNVVTGNVCRRNDHTGIYLYGRHNVVTGNQCISNGYEGTSLQWGGITIGGAFGGTGQFNHVADNLLDDPEASPTQYFGIKVLAVGYTAWAGGQAITVGLYRTNDLKLYKATTAGTTGATAPVHTSGTASDDAVTWQYIDAFYGATREPYGNVIGPNTLHRSTSTTITDGTTNHRNSTIDLSLISVLSGAGSPEGAVAANRGAIFLRTDGGASTTLYIKEANATSTGWVAK